MEIRVIRGKDQIGGNIIEVTAGKTRILLDAGLDLKPENNRSLPVVDGLFDRKGYDAVFISHYHSDHLGLAYSIYPDIPLYIGEPGYRIVKASDDYKGVESIHPAGFLKDGEPVRIGDITVTPFLCDHSAFDSHMLLCDDGKETVLYTGDFRSNGRKSYDRLLEHLPRKVDRLICEGTTLSREGYVARFESDLEEEAAELFRQAKGPVFVLQSSMNIDRLVTMYRAAKKSSRLFLEDLYLADIATAAGSNIPNPSFPDVFAFITNPARYEALCKYEHKVGKQSISKARFVMCVRASMLKYLQSLAKEMSFENGLLIYSFWSGYREAEEMQDFLGECQNMGLTVRTLHTSGHADQAAIRKLIETVEPTEIIPVHTEYSGWFDSFK